MGNIFSLPTQRSYQELFNASNTASNTQIINSIQNDVDQEDIEKGFYSANQKDSNSIRTDLYQFLPKTHPLKSNLNSFVGISIVLLFYVILKREISQSTQIAALNEKFAIFENKHFYLKDENAFLTGFKDQLILNTAHNKLNQGVIEVDSNRTLDIVDSLAQLIVLKEPNLQLTLPAANTLITGLSFKFFGTFTSSLTENGSSLIKPMAGSLDFIELGNKHNATSIYLNSGEYLELVANKEANCWYAANRNTALGLTPSFEGSAAGKMGWQKFTKGRIVEWGEGRTDQSGVLDIKFSAPFTEQDSITLLGTYVNMKTGSERIFAMGYAYNAISKTGIQFRALDDVDGSPLRNTVVRWEVKGY